MQSDNEKGFKLLDMADLKALHLSHLPKELLAYVALYQAVQNAPAIRRQLLEGNNTFEYAFIDATAVSITLP